MSPLRDRLALITGATGGFGSEMARQLVAEGSRLILTDLNEDSLNELIGSLPDNVVAGSIAVNLATREGCESLAEQSQAIGEIDLLINNAGIAPAGSFVEIPNQEWEKLIEINLLAPMRLTHLILPGMLERKRGHIVNISSAAGLSGSVMLAPYCASKFGLRGFGESIQQEIHGSGVSLTTVYPFFSRTNILQSQRFGDIDDKALPEFFLSDPSDVVRAIIKGVKTDAQEVYPDIASNLIEIGERFLPKALRTYKNALGSFMTTKRD